VAVIKAANQKISRWLKHIGEIMSNVKVQTSTSYRDYLLKSLVEPDRAAGYLDATLEHEREDPIPDLLQLALSNVVAAKAQIDELSPHAKELHEIIDRVLAETKGVEIYGLIDLLDALGFRLAIIPQEKLLEDNSPI
jgi:DNA-binding phage protein